MCASTGQGRLSGSARRGFGSSLPGLSIHGCHGSPYLVRLARHLRAAGIRAVHIRRERREGFKAGALADGLLYAAVLVLGQSVRLVGDTGAKAPQRLNRENKVHA